MAMKRKALMGLLVIMVTLFFADMAYALSTRAEIHLTIRVVGALSLDLENESLQQNLEGGEAEAFSELKEKGILVDKLNKGNSTVWLFTKTE